MSLKNDLSNWKAKLGASHKRYKAMEKKIDRYRRYYRNNQGYSNELGTISYPGYREPVIDNVIFSNIRTIVPRLVTRNPKIYVSPKKRPYQTKKGIFNTLQGAALWEVLLNYFYEELKIRREVRKCIYDMLLGYWGIAELGYMVKTDKIRGEELLDVDEILKEDSAFVKRRSPCDFRFDVEATDHLLDDGEWIAFKWVKDIEDIKKNPRFSNTRGLKSNFTVKTDYDKSKSMRYYSGEDHDLWERVLGWTVWNKKLHKRYDIVEEHDKFLSNEDWPLDLEGFPCEILYINENPDDALPLPDLDVYIDSQDELNKMASLMLSHAKKISNRKYVSRVNAFTPEEKDKLEMGEDGLIVESSVNPESALVPIKDITISQDLYLVRNQIKRSIMESQGISPGEKGQIEKFDTATEPALLNIGSQTIRDDQRSLVEDFNRRIVKKMAQIISQTLGDNETMEIPLDNEQFERMQDEASDKLSKIVGQDDKIIILPWLELSKEDIQGEYDFDIEVGSTAPVNDDMRKRDAVALANILGNDPYIRGRQARRELLEAFKHPDPDKLLKTDEEVARDQASTAQAAQAGEVFERKSKDSTDILKTKLKTASAERIADKKAGIETKKTSANLLAAMLKGKNGGK